MYPERPLKAFINKQIKRLIDILLVPMAVFHVNGDTGNMIH